MDRTGRIFAIIFVCGILGVVFAIMLQLLNTAGILVDEFITASLTIREVQVIVIMFWFLLGIAISAMEER